VRRPIRFEILDEGFGGAPMVSFWSLDVQLQRLLRLAIANVPARSIDRSGRPIALLATSYNAEDGCAPLADELEGVERALGLLDRAGYAIAVKQHPRERDGKYDALPAFRRAADLRVLDEQTPIEAYFAALWAPDVVVSLLSNALFTARVLFDLPVFLMPGRESGVPFNTVSEPVYARHVPGGLPTIDALPRVDHASVDHAP
jgi:hypothetical protein